MCRTAIFPPTQPKVNVVTRLLEINQHLVCYGGDRCWQQAGLLRDKLETAIISTYPPVNAVSAPPAFRISIRDHLIVSTRFKATFI